MPEEEFKLKETILGEELELEYQTNMYIKPASRFPISFGYDYSEQMFLIEKAGATRLIKYMQKYGEELLEKLDAE